MRETDVSTKVQNRKPGVNRRFEDGVTLVELMIALLVLVIGIVGAAQLFVVAQMSQTLAINQSSGAEDMQRFIDSLRTEISNNGLGTYNSGTNSIDVNPWVFSSTYDEGDDYCYAFGDYMNGYQPAWFRPNVWIYDHEGDLVNPYGTVSPAAPPDVDAADLIAPSTSSIVVYVRMDPKDDSAAGARWNLPVTVKAVISGHINGT
jgi:prepilin-type N-terminal cleavage/methylation domain-containing protein